MRYKLEISIGILVLIFLFWMQFLVSYFLPFDKEAFFSLLKFEWLIVYSLALIISIRTSGIVSIYSLFLILSFVFNYARIFLEMISDYQLSSTDLFSRIELSIDTEITLLILIVNLLLFSLLSYVMFYRKSTISLAHKRSYTLPSKYLIYILLVPVILFNIQDLIYILNNGYLSLFNGDYHEKMNFLSLILPRLMFIAFMFFLAGVPEELEFKKISYIYLVVLLLSALKGQRGEILLFILMLVWYHNTMYQKNFAKLNFKYIALIPIVFISFSQFLLAFRSNVDVEPNNFLYEFFRINGISINIPAYLIEFNESMSSGGVPYFFAPIVDYFYRVFIDRDIFYQGPSVDLLDASNSLSHHMIYFINPDAYFMGNGTGSSYLAELYDFAGIFFSGFVLFGIVFLAVKLEQKMKVSRNVLLFSPIIMMGFVYMPRGSLLKIIDDLALLTLFFLVSKVILKATLKK